MVMSVLMVPVFWLPESFGYASPEVMALGIGGVRGVSSSGTSPNCTFTTSEPRLSSWNVVGGRFFIGSESPVDIFPAGLSSF